MNDGEFQATTQQAFNGYLWSDVWSTTSDRCEGKDFSEPFCDSVAHTSIKSFSSYEKRNVIASEGNYVSPVAIFWTLL